MPLDCHVNVKGVAMLVLARKEGEAIRIGKDTWVYVVDLSSTTVRLGVTAPDNVDVLREELIDGGKAVRDTGQVRALLPNDDG